jgi:hypothetical protein
VLDAKFGRGVEVEAEENPQLLMYAHAVFKEWDLIHDFTKVTVGIVQPRLGASPEWSLSLDDLKNFAQRVREAADATRWPDAPLWPTPRAASGAAPRRPARPSAPPSWTTSTPWCPRPPTTRTSPA